MDVTPVKQSDKSRHNCVVCGKIAKEPRRIERSRSAFDIKQLLKKYGGIEIRSGTLCRYCYDKMINLHKKTMLFYELCQSNYSKILLHGKRMASTPPSRQKSKRQDTTCTPERVHNLQKSTPQRQYSKHSKIPTPTSAHRKQKKETGAVETRVIQGKKCLFANSYSPDIDCFLETDLMDLMDNIPVGMEIEVDSAGCTTAKNDTASVEQTKCTDHDGYIKSSDKLSNSSQKPTKDTKFQEEILHAPPISHDYIKSQKKPCKYNVLYEDIRSFCKEYKETDEKISEKEYCRLMSACQCRDLQTLCRSILSIDSVRKNVVEILGKESNTTASQMTNRKHDTSILMEKSLSDLKRFDWFIVVEEFKRKFPDLFYQLLSIMISRDGMGLYTKIEGVVPRLGVIYGVMMQARFQELSLIQRLNSLLLFDSICDVKVYDRLHRQGLCLGYAGSVNLLRIVGGKFNDNVIELVKNRKRFRIIGDNINWTESVHDQRKDHTSHMQHAFGSAILVQNMNFSTCQDVYPQKHVEDTSFHEFIPSPDDFNLYRRDFTVLMSRVAFRHLPYFQVFQDIVPLRLSQHFDDNMSMKTKVIPLPVLFKNEQKYQDVVDILDFYEQIVTDAHTESGVNCEHVHIHIGGDQLTRERFSGAKCLRAHEDTPLARFEHLSPITFEFFHMHMNYLKMAFKILFDDKSVQDTGTLKSMQNIISRTHVGENVNTHYDADKDFFISVVDVYIVECFMEFFGMNDVNSAPSKNTAPDFETPDEKREWYFQTVGKMIDQNVFTSSLIPEKQSDSIQVEGTVFDVKLPDGGILTVNIPPKSSNMKKHDKVLAYSRRVLELGLLFKDLLDATKLPERNRHISLLKLTMLLFKSHKNLSKYALEILRLLVHQICIMSEKSAQEEFYGLFVNTNGKCDGHIPADRQMEYLVKKVKTHIKHMYSNKTEKNITTKTSAISGISDVGVRYDTMTNVLTRTKRHSDRSGQGDEMILLESLRKLRPFRETEGRYHTHFPDIEASNVDGLDVQHYHEWINTRKYNMAVEMGN